MSFLTVAAIFEDGVFRPTEPLPLSTPQRVTLVVQFESGPTWPDDVAAIYQEIAAEDRRLADSMLPGVRRSWPIDQERL
jgi:predicted DNA-binding antitoxin AbrB/MazE fold protein